MTSFDPGEVYGFNYLWKREAVVGEESGRKARPACVMFRSTREPSSEIFLFPISTRFPGKERLSIEISSSERRLGGLGQPSWLLIDEYNITLETRTYDFVSLNPLGRFSTKFTQEIAIRIRAGILSGAVVPVRRS